MVKITFSSIGCPEWSWKDMIATARKLGYHGIEIAQIGHQLDFSDPSQLTGDLNQLGISCLASAVHFQNDLEDALRVGEDLISIATKLGVPFVRILGDKNAAPGKKPFPRLQVREGLEVLSKIARRNGVGILLETNGHLADSRLLAELLDEVGDPAIGVLWDIHHPFRYFNELPKLTAARLGKAIKYLHVEDSKVIDGKVKYTALGEGEVPVRGALEALLDLGYNGWIGSEWSNQSQLEPEKSEAIFRHFITTIQQYLKELQG